MHVHLDLLWDHIIAQIIDQELEVMIQTKIVEPSTSPWSAPIVIVEKKTLRRSSREGIPVLYRLSEVK